MSTAQVYCEPLCAGWLRGFLGRRPPDRLPPPHSNDVAAPVYFTVYLLKLQALLVFTYPGCHNVYQLFSIQHNNTLGDEEVSIVLSTIHKWTQNMVLISDFYGVILSVSVGDARRLVICFCRAPRSSMHLCLNNVLRW